MSHAELIRLIRQQDRLVLKARDARDAALAAWHAARDSGTGAAAEAAYEEAKWKYLAALIDFNREIANA